MGCFRGCFGSSKNQKRQKQATYKVLPRDQNNASHKPLQATVGQVQGHTENPINSVPELRYTDKADEQLSLSTRKKVTFDSNIKTYEHAVYESTDSLPEKDKIDEKEKNERVQKSSNCENDSITSSVGTYPANHRYQNCQESDNEIDESEPEYEDNEDDDDIDEQLGEEYDTDVESDARIVCQEVWSESVPTESVESRTDVSLAGLAVVEEIRSIGSKSNQNVRDRSVYVHPVLNPVENLTQWKAVKSRGTPPLNQQKENFNAELEVPRISFSQEPSFKHSQPQKPQNPNTGIAVDASLSNWLGTPEQTTPLKKASSTGLEIFEKSGSQGSFSPKSFEDRPILGALTVEELRQFSANNSPRKSPNRSPDDMPIIGTVGTYWNHRSTGAKDSGSASSYKGIPNTTSKYREDKRVNWHSTPFETRLERALRKGDAAGTE